MYLFIVLFEIENVRDHMCRNQQKLACTFGTPKFFAVWSFLFYNMWIVWMMCMVHFFLLMYLNSNQMKKMIMLPIVVQIVIIITVSSNKTKGIAIAIPTEKLNPQNKKMGEMVVLIVSESIVISL